MTKQTDEHSHTVIHAVEALIEEIPADSIVSRTVLSDGETKILLFGFAPGQELSEHTAPRSAMLHFLRGRARLTLGDDTLEAEPGTLAHMAPNLPHSIRAHSEVLMLLIMLPREGANQS